MSNFTLSQSGAKKLHAYVEGKPECKIKLGKSFQTAPGTFLKDASELNITDVNAALGTQFKTGAEAHEAIGSAIALGFNDYGSHTVGIDLRALHAVSMGTQPRSRHSELAS